MADRHLTYDDVADLLTKSAVSQVTTLRSLALSAYVNLEVSTARLFNATLGVPPKISDAIFWKIHSINSRCALLSELMTIKYKTKYAIWWKGMSKELRDLSDERNKIAHWQSRQIIDFTKESEVVKLLHPSDQDFFKLENGLAAKDLAKIVRRINFASNDVMEFVLYLEGHLPKSQGKFLKPRIYPSLETHPVLRKRPKA